ncbi:MAG: chromosomal replication initiator protein DnaA [Verrucomicrobiales bacterium]
MTTDQPSLAWQLISEAIKPHVGVDTFQRWFADVSVLEINATTMVLEVPNSIHQLWIESNYLSLLKASVIQVLGESRDIEFLCQQGTHRTKSRSSRAAADEEASQIETPASKGAPGRNGSVSFGLNPRYVFENYVVGTNNQFAHAAAHAVAQAPARTYNPLFLYGGTGLGKTHLMQAICHHVVSQKKNMRVVYLTSEQFTNEFIEAIQHSTLVKFRKRYRQADVLLIDDIQFLAGKERSQEEFFHTFNTLFDGHKQIVLSSDKPASEIGSLQDRLVNRFEWGLTAELQPPDVETRIAILRKKAELLPTHIDDETIQFLANHIKSNVRRLEGALVKVASYQSLSGSALDLSNIESLLKDILQEEAKKIVTIDQIQRRVAEHYDVRLADMTSKRRPASIAFPRQIAMYLARELTSLSLNEIGDAFGGRDHGTVLHAYKSILRKMKDDEKLRQAVSLLDTSLKG